MILILGAGLLNWRGHNYIDDKFDPVRYIPTFSKFSKIGKRIVS